MAEAQTWREETDLAEVKKLSLAFLDLDIKLTKFSPLVVSHPYSDSGIVGIKGEDGNMKVVDLTKDPAAAGEWRKQKEEQIRETDGVFPLFMMVSKPYRMGFLKYAAPFLSEQDAAKVLPYAWTSAEAPNNDPNLTKRDLVKLFRSIDPRLLMGDEEYERFQGLDDVVTVYRGVTPHNAKNVKALSWTLERKTAEWFAHRFGEQGTVYEAHIPKKYIHAVFLGRNESEVIVDPKGLRDIVQVMETTQSTHREGKNEMTMGGAIMQVNAMTEQYEHIELFGKPVLFTNARVDEATVPKGWYRYDIRGSDTDPGSLCTLERRVGVNHAGTILSPEEIAFPKGKDYKPIRGSQNFLGDELTITEFCQLHGLPSPEQELRGQETPVNTMTMGGI